MKISESFGMLPPKVVIDEISPDDQRDLDTFANDLLRRHVAPEEAAELIVDAYEEGVFTWEEATQVALRVRL